MGTWFLFIAFAGYLSIVFHNVSHHFRRMIVWQRTDYAAEFFISALLMSFVVVIYFCLLPVIKKKRITV